MSPRATIWISGTGTGDFGGRLKPGTQLKASKARCFKDGSAFLPALVSLFLDKYLPGHRQKSGTNI